MKALSFVKSIHVYVHWHLFTNMPSGIDYASSGYLCKKYCPKLTSKKICVRKHVIHFSIPQHSVLTSRNTPHTTHTCHIPPGSVSLKPLHHAQGPLCFTTNHMRDPEPYCFRRTKFLTPDLCSLVFSISSLNPKNRFMYKLLSSTLLESAPTWPIKREIMKGK